MTTKKQVDILFSNEKKGYYDFDIAENGDISTTNGLDSALALTFFTNQRADSSEVQNSINRGGWWGNTLTIYSTEIGSKIWLIQSDTISDATRSAATNYARNAYQYLIDLKLADDVIVTSQVTTQRITINIKAIIGTDISSFNTDLWSNTHVSN